LRYRIECIKEEAEQPLSNMEMEARTIGRGLSHDLLFGINGWTDF
jgi:hypothetical protein